MWKSQLLERRRISALSLSLHHSYIRCSAEFFVDFSVIIGRLNYLTCYARLQIGIYKMRYGDIVSVFMDLFVISSRRQLSLQSH